jgi:hypothetical protein
MFFCSSPPLADGKFSWQMLFICFQHILVESTTLPVCLGRLNPAFSIISGFRFQRNVSLVISEPRHHFPLVSFRA